MHLAEWVALGITFVAGAWWWWRLTAFLDRVETRLRSIDETLEKRSKR